jgi:hypothetical protein
MSAIKKFLIFAVITTSAWCQTPQPSTGPTLKVIDPSGAPIPHAKVRITLAPNHLETNAEGKVDLDLASGNYEVEVRESGFKTYRDNVVVSGAKNETINVTLKIGSYSGPTVVKTFDSEEEKAVWKLENDYWLYVRDLELEKYKALWHASFIGWPYVSATPVRKNEITKWIEQRQANGLHLQTFDMRPAESVLKTNMVITFYWITARWVDKDGKGEPQTSRITHTWIKEGAKWQIIGGMSAVSESDVW